MFIFGEGTIYVLDSAAASQMRVWANSTSTNHSPVTSVTFAGPTHILIEESNVIALRRARLLDALPIQKSSCMPLLMNAKRLLTLCNSSSFVKQEENDTQGDQANKPVVAKGLE